MAPPQPPPRAWSPSPAPRGVPVPALVGVVIGLVAIVMFLVFFVFAGASFMGGSPGFPGGSGGFPGFFLGILCLPLLFVLVFVIVLFASASGRRTIPPPPPIQQPMVPAGQQGPVPLNCPNCGGPPTNVDRFGIATCSYCGTRFLVR